MIKKDRGDNHYYEFAYPRYSLLHARIMFINAVSHYVPRVYAELHEKPSALYRDSGLLSLKRKRRVDFWETCSGGAGLFIPGESRPFSLSNSQETIKRFVYQFFPDWGLDITKDEHIDHFNKKILPGLTAWIESLDEWASKFSLQAGWMYAWAFLKLDTYNDRETRSYESPIYQEINPVIPDIFGTKVQPPRIHEHYINKVSGSDFWIGEFSFKSEPWRPLIQTKKECEEMIREDFEKALKRYLENAVRYLDLRPDLRRSGQANDDHYKWLANYQCDQSKSISGIANQVGRDRTTVRDAIHDLREFIGLPVRSSSKSGRKPGSKNKSTRKRAQK